MPLAAPSACSQCGAATGLTDGLCTVCRGDRRPAPELAPPAQELLPGMGPRAGDRYRHRVTGTIAAVVSTELCRYGWVTIRVYGAETQVTLGSFERTYQPLHT